MSVNQLHRLSFLSIYRLNSVVVSFCFFLTLFFSYEFSQAQITSTVTGGNWSATSTWVGGVVPGAGQSVTIAAGALVEVDINTPTVLNIVVNAGGTLRTNNVATSTLTYSGTMTVSGALVNYGGMVQTTSGRAFTLSGAGSYTHNPRNLTLIDEQIFSRSVENFSATSHLHIMKWFDLNLPLGHSTRVTGNFGNVTMNIPDLIPWEQDDEFMSGGVQRIFGTLTVSSGIVSMDEGSAMSTYMEFNDVMINGTGSIIFISGPSRPFVLITNNFTDNSTSANPTIIMNNVFNLTQWNVNGNLSLGHNFFGIVGTGVNPGGSFTLQVSGNLDITGGSVQFVSAAAAPATITVNANTTISGNPTKVRFLDGNLGNLTFTTNNLVISGGGDNVLMGGNGLIPQATGVPNIVINNDLIVNGASNSYILDASNTTQKLRLRIGHDLIINGLNSNFTAARSKGALTVHVTNNITLSNGKFIGQIDTLNAAIDSVYVGGSFLMNSPTTSDYFRVNYGTGNTFFRCMGNFTQSSTSVGQGIGFAGVYSSVANMNFQVTGTFNMTGGRFSGIYNNKPHIKNGNLTFTASTNFGIAGGFFRGIDNTFSDNLGTVTFNIGNLLYSGGNFSGYYSVHSSTGTANFAINGMLQLTFATAATDSFSFIGFTEIGAVVNSLKLNVTVGGNFNITGPAGSFISSVANGNEIFSIVGSMNISGGKNSFNSYPNSGLPNSHVVRINVGSDLAVFGGIVYLSAHNDSLIANVGGNMSVSLGELVVQGGNTFASLDVIGGFTQTGGIFSLHKNISEFSYSPVSITINSDNNAVGDFSHTGGTINFDNNTTSTQVMMYINSPNITYGGTGTITMADPGTNLISGSIRYGRDGIANFSRTSNTHSIQQVTQSILSGCTLTVINGNLQIASHVNPTINRLTVESEGVLDLQGNQVFSNSLQANAGMTVYGRVRITRAQGFYDGTANAAINSTGGMNYFFLTNSVVEYYGNNNQIITGIGVGLALGSPQKYYNLEINFTGTPNTEFVYPTNIPTTRSVFVRNKLILTNGELNLDNDHDPLSGGRSIIVERDSLTAITRVNGYIRSEVYDSSASVIWRVNSRTGPRIIPFGFNSTNYIPFTFDLVSGSADTLIVSTYHTPLSDNLPYPPPVTHVNNVPGADNSAFTVDRFWYIASTGTSTNANLTFKCTPAELGTIANPRAQCWIPDGTTPNAWQLPLQGVQSTQPNGTYVLGADFYPNNWWTLAGLLNPLPVSMLDFTADCKSGKTELNWATATEQNNDHFTILKSNDGINYNPVGNVEGNGNSVNLIQYNFIDQVYNSQITYYKLIQTDYDGYSTEYGPIIADPCTRVSLFEVSVIPSNPDELAVVIKNPESDKFNITLYSIEGKLIVNKVEQLNKGLNVISLPTNNISSGIYFVNVRSSSESSTTKVSLGMVR